VSSAGPKLRAGFRLVPEIGASSHTIVATTSQFIRGVQRISRRLLTKIKMRNTSRPVSATSQSNTCHNGQPAPGNVMPLFTDAARPRHAATKARAPATPPSICEMT
jgi:hypothetical protein